MNRKVMTVCGLLAPVLFVAAIGLFGAMQPDYSHFTRAVSELGARGAPHALAWNVIGFVGVGAMVVVFAWGLFRSTGSWSALGWVGLSGIGFAASGVFPADMNDLSAPLSRLHIVASRLSFGAFLTGCFMLSWRLYRRPGWKPAAVASGIIGVVAFVTMPLREVGVPPGLAQRITFACYFLWIGVLAVTLLRSGPGRSPDPAARPAQQDN